MIGKKLRRYMISVLAVMLVFVTAGCGSTGEEDTSTDVQPSGGDTITVLNYGEYMEPAVLKQFEKETGIKVLYEEATTPEEMYSKYTSSTIPYDLICSSDYMIERLISEGEQQYEAYG